MFPPTPRRLQWLASITGSDGRNKTVGYYMTQLEAAHAWDADQRKLGRKDCNFPRLDRGEVQAIPGHSSKRAATLTAVALAIGAPPRAPSQKKKRSSSAA